MIYLEQILDELDNYCLISEEKYQNCKIELLNIDIQRRNLSPYFEFLQIFNSISGKNYKGDIESRRLYYKRSTVYSKEDFEKIIKNTKHDTWLQENFNVLTPFWLLKQENCTKYYNYQPDKIAKNDDYITNESKSKIAGNLSVASSLLSK